MKYLTFFGFMSLCIFFIYRMFATSTDDHSLEHILAKDPIIIDVRTPEEYKMGHINGSLNISLAELEKGTPLSLDLKCPILTCCSHGVRSIQAVKILVNRGYQNASNGGAWTNLQMLMDKYHHSKVSDIK
ncbi:rhodanese-like domain-containing protein [Mucilaginibacter sabulilitoris]|uniref:Rhodanese-like domain-containing protein n=1 Tax=Mucilaginibacter sabulilitoris TaxID=1173583 RepID=A0ABZ0TEW5_9SPHI|nr:rhodanese-like domain-containing protein [Mucilaginibacter sabulilitoris]WPU91721.1 rhodanese-like domain-containing protein [Mucilaginibacter sabulilitoris]